MRFVDRSTTPAFVEEASRIALTGRGLGTAPDSRGQVAMNGRLTGGAPFEIKGTLGAIGGPLNFELDGKLSDFPLHARESRTATSSSAGSRGAARSGPPCTIGW